MQLIERTSNPVIPDFLMTKEEIIKTGGSFPIKKSSKFRDVMWFFKGFSFYDFFRTIFKIKRTSKPILRTPSQRLGF